MTAREQPPWSADETSYCEYLAGERHMFAWCLVRYGGMSDAEASLAAEQFYAYEIAGAPMRGLVFHDEAWHWAMLRLFGDRYWVTRSDLEHPPEEYRTESLS